MFRRFLVCACLIHAAAVHSLFDIKDPEKRNISDRAEMNLMSEDQYSVETGVWNQGKPKTVFARRAVKEQQILRALKQKQAPEPPSRRCSRVMESCIFHSLCCDPCASCHCRFFNAICYCRRLNRHCQKKT
ncbi:agouti-signaling protein 2b [Lepisosteus oculatus]|uniref:agouti-signaling protein 2b n=1 Tax=Lepisosteus oculatus TaxID=7918 RepID=UPI00371FD9C1